MAFRRFSTLTQYYDGTGIPHDPSTVTTQAALVGQAAHYQTLPQHVVLGEFTLFEREGKSLNIEPDVECFEVYD